jgi:hypothetical protein
MRWFSMTLKKEENTGKILERKNCGKKEGVRDLLLMALYKGNNVKHRRDIRIVKIMFVPCRN